MGLVSRGDGGDWGYKVPSSCKWYSEMLGSGFGAAPVKDLSRSVGKVYLNQYTYKIFKVLYSEGFIDFTIRTGDQSGIIEWKTIP